MTTIDRRAFLAASAASLPIVSSLGQAQETTAISPQHSPAPSAARPAARPPVRPIAIASANGMSALTRAMEMMRGAPPADPLDAIVAGINIVEDDPNDQSVGYGGLPNEDGIVELDASCMHGPSHKAGAVAGLRNIKNPSSVALQVLRRTDHALLVGEGALQFAQRMGFQEVNLLTDAAREAWLNWKAELNRQDKWLNEDQQIPRSNMPRLQSRAEELGLPFTTGTIHVSAIDSNGDMASCTSTSGLSWKIPGRVGDSPIVGAGMYCDNDIGSAGATGRGEACIQSCAAFQIVQHMANGVEPTDACLRVLQWIADHTRQSYLLDAKGRPNFAVTLYALRKDGAYGSAEFRPGKKFALHDGAAARLEQCTALYEE